MKTRIRGNRIFLQSIGLLILRNAKTRTNIFKSRFSSSKITKIDISGIKNIQNRFRTLITRTRVVGTGAPLVKFHQHFS